MPSPRFQNYLRANRKRLGLSQEDVAFLLGLPTGQKVSRHEQFVHIPTLAAVFAYEVIYKRAASELFSDLYQKVEKEIAKRAKALGKRPLTAKPTLRHARRHNILADLAGAND